MPPVMQTLCRLNYRSVAFLALGCLVVVWMAGCHHRDREVVFTPSCEPCQEFFQQIEYPDAGCDVDSDGTEFMTGPPMTVSNYENLEPWNLTVDQCVELTLANSKIMNKLGGLVVSAPQAASTLYDQALFETNPFGSVEAALSAFDAQYDSSLFFTHTEPATVGFSSFGNIEKTDGATFNAGLSKQTASGASFSLRSNTNYARSKIDAISLIFPERNWEVTKTFEMRQPLLRNRGTQVNRIAGPNATPGNYNGVLISRIRSDISLADFEASVRDLVRDVVNNYWLLYFGYRDLDTAILARDAARDTWANRKLRLDNGVGRPDDEAQARQQYYRFEQLAQTALVGLPQGRLGVLGAERELRRLMGLPVYDGKVIRPITEPITAPVAFNWENSQIQTLGRRVEVRRQKWQIRQRELELVAAKQLYRWRFDLVGNYNFGGFSQYQWMGNDYPANQPTPPSTPDRKTNPTSAWSKLLDNHVADWNLGFEFGGAVGNRQGHLAIRNAELNLTRERALLKEQQRQLLHDLSSAFSEVDRAFEAMRVSFNQRVAVQAELEPKQKRVEEGQDQVFFLLDAQQRAATAESDVHRSISDYNLALMQYAFTTGSLLSRYNIYLTEGPWCEDAEAQADVNASRFRSGKLNTKWLDTYPLSFGPYDQMMPGPMNITTDEPSPTMDSEIPLLMEEGRD